MWVRWVGALLACAGLAAAETSAGLAARQWRETHERSILDEFADFLRLPNIASNPDGLRQNAEYIERMFARRGVDTRLLEIDGAPPVVYGELLTPEANQTVIFYAHYDGQPVEPSEWYTGDPFRPTLMSGPISEGGQPIPLPRPGWPSDPEWRLYARSAGDDKAAIIALATALDAIQAHRVPIQSNVKFFFEGEEEAGSPHLGRYLEEYRELLDADVWLFCDGPVHQTRQQQIVFGARGIVGLDLTVYGARRELHSGHYGNWAPNPPLMLAQLIASMKDPDGEVLVEGFYDGIDELEESAKQAIEEAPDFALALRRELWIARSEGGDRRIEEAISLPALNVRGLLSAAVGDQARNIIPVEATASLDVRLVKGMDHRVAVERILDHIRQQGYHVTEMEPTQEVRLAFPKVCWVRRDAGYNAVRTSLDLEISQRVIAAVEAARGPVIKLPTLGGSLPLHVFEETLGATTIVVPVANHDNAQHSHNENLRLQNLWDGIETMAALLALPAPEEEASVPEV
ncbi:MAG: M20/M25/M40 family metallo-hydrolase [bacterium]|nr:M20/M25/M40 family metallo-hydrolase [bacterium]